MLDRKRLGWGSFPEAVQRGVVEHAVGSLVGRWGMGDLE